MKKEIEKIKDRNKKVETEKAWETSKTRKLIITFMTYIVIVILLLLINVSNPWLMALVPTIGYALSTLTLPIFKKWWIKSVYKK